MIWTLERIWRATNKAVKIPLSRLHSENWGVYDHRHICLAARLLEADDFHKLCDLAPVDIEHHDRCDDCPYMTLLQFLQTADGKKLFFSFKE